MQQSLFLSWSQPLFWALSFENRDCSRWFTLTSLQRLWIIRYNVFQTVSLHSCEAFLEVWSNSGVRLQWTFCNISCIICQSRWQDIEQNKLLFLALLFENGHYAADNLLFYLNNGPRETELQGANGDFRRMEKEMTSWAFKEMNSDSCRGTKCLLDINILLSCDVLIVDVYDTAVYLSGQTIFFL